jgi:hypothetical protein
MKNKLLPLALVVLTVSCSSEGDKPTYAITTDDLRLYKSGDISTFTFSGTRTETGIDEVAGTIEHRWQASSLTSSPDGLSTFSNPLLLKQTIAALDRGDEFRETHFTQDANGNITVFAMRLGSDKILWLREQNAADKYGVLFQTSPFDPGNLESPQFDVYVCENSACNKAGTGYQTINYVGREEQSTPYAFFEAYAVDYQFNVSSTDSQLLLDEDIVNSSGRKWIFPGVGVVKFVYNAQIVNDSGSEILRIVAGLNNTSIKVK